MPEAVLPGQDPQRGPAQDPAPAPARAAAPAATPERQAQEGLLDYLLGGGS
jgi:3-oxoacyl-ACP reductase-like protein